MTRAKVSFDGRNNNGTYDIDEQGQDGGGYFIELSNPKEAIKAWFESVDEYKRFHRGVALCRASYNCGEMKEVYLTAFVSKQSEKKVIDLQHG